MDQTSAHNDIVSLAHNKILDSIKEHEEAREVKLFFEVDNGMRIKNPLSNTQPPNSFVYMKPSFDCKEQGIFI